MDKTEKLNILVIEDNLGDFILIEEYLLEKFNLVNIIHFSDFSNSINYLQDPKEKVSLILLDLHLPDFQEIRLITKILSYNLQIPIIILTGYSDLSLAKKSLQLGIYDYLIKDEITPAILHKTIIFALNRSNYIFQIEDEKRNSDNLFNFNPQPTWLLDASTLKILDANLAAQKKYGYLLEDFLKMTFTQFHPEEEKELIQQILFSNKRMSSKNHFTHILNDGKKINVDIYSKEFNTSSQNRLIVQSNDISEILSYINTIEIQNTKLSNIAWTQSHVVRAPLSRILGIVNLLELQPENFDELSFWLEQLKISSNELDVVIKNIVSETINMKTIKK